MSDFDSLVPPHIRALGAYTPGKPIRKAQQESGVQCFKMASNENPFGPSPKALAAIREAAASANLYPDNDSSQLTHKLAALHNLESEQVIVGAGSTSLLDIMARTLLAPGLNAVTSERTFIVYPIATRAAGGKLITVPTRDDGYDLDAIASAIDRETRLVYLANPNNPTGTLFDAAATDRFLDRVPDHVVVVLDEAYCDFGAYFARQRGIDYSHSPDYVRQGRNVVVLRTFSKAHGLAGIRLGYGFGPAKLLNYFARVRVAFAVSAIAEAAGLAALDDHDHIRKAVENNAAGARYLLEQFREMGIRAIATFANFIFFEIEDAASISKRLQEAGIIVRPMTAWGIPNGIRVTIGTPEQNRAFAAALKKVTEKAAVR